MSAHNFVAFAGSYNCSSIGPYMARLRQAFRAACQQQEKLLMLFMLHVTAFQAFHAACHSFVALASFFDKGRILVSRLRFLILVFTNESLPRTTFSILGTLLRW